MQKLIKLKQRLERELWSREDSRQARTGFMNIGPTSLHESLEARFMDKTDKEIKNYNKGFSIGQAAQAQDNTLDMHVVCINQCNREGSKKDR